MLSCPKMKSRLQSIENGTFSIHLWFLFSSFLYHRVFLIANRFSCVNNQNKANRRKTKIFLKGLIIYKIPNAFTPYPISLKTPKFFIIRTLSARVTHFRGLSSPKCRSNPPPPSHLAEKIRERHTEITKNRHYTVVLIWKAVPLTCYKIIFGIFLRVWKSVRVPLRILQKTDKELFMREYGKFQWGKGDVKIKEYTLLTHELDLSHSVPMLSRMFHATRST